jgi:hypothetical protein
MDGTTSMSDRPFSFCQARRMRTSILNKRLRGSLVQWLTKLLLPFAL